MFITGAYSFFLLTEFLREKKHEQKKQLFSNALSELQERKKTTDRESYEPLIEQAEALLQKCTTDEVIMDTGNESLSELYFLTAELLFGYDLAVRFATHSKSLTNEARTLEYYHKAIALEEMPFVILHCFLVV